MASSMDPQIVRLAFGELPAGTSHGERASPQGVYLPRSHLKALDPNVLLVTGMRGAGKTFWWSALQEGEVRQVLARSGERTALTEHTLVRVGFGVRRAPDDYPSADALQSLQAQQRPRDIWRTVLAYQLAKGTGHPLAGLDSWAARAEFVGCNTEAIDRFMQERDDELDWQGIDFLLLFDGLDRCAESVAETTQWLRALLQVALEVRAYQRIRIKAFLRSDQAGDSAIADFPDASKVLATQVELTWPRHELYGLLWHHLANGTYGEMFRPYLWQRWQSVAAGNQTVHLVPRQLVTNEDMQREKFHALAGERMGGRRGTPYSWLPDRLADADRRISARSFLAALRYAAQDTQNEHSDHECGLHHDSIIHGVQQASIIRVREMQEDYPWIADAMSALKGMNVPERFEAVEERWRKERVLEKIGERQDSQLAPRHLADGAAGIRGDLEAQGVFQRLRDGRVNVPDVYRVGYGLGRHGGVQPVR